MTSTNRRNVALGLAAMILAWEVLALANAGSFVIAGPRASVTHIWANAQLLIRALGATLHAAAWGFLWGNLAALLLAGLVMLVPRSERMISLLALVIFCLPLVATGPILRVLFGPGAGPQITLAALAVYYTTYLAVLVGLRSVPQGWSDLMRIYGRSRLSELIFIRARACIPYFAAALQIAAPVAFLGAMVGEFTGAERGLGVLTLRAMRGMDVEATWAIALLAACVSSLAYVIFGKIGASLSPHRPVLLLSTGATEDSASGGMRFLQMVGIALLVFVLWQAIMDGFGLNRFFAKRPGDVWSYLTSNAEARETLWAALSETFLLTIPGYVAGLILGAGLAMVLSIAPSFSTAILPVAIALRSVPIVTTAPLLVLALGRGVVGTVCIVAVMIFFPTLVACAQGLRQTPGAVTDLFQTYAASRLRVLLWARVPSMLPAFFASARMAVPAALLAVTTAEWLATGRGIGHLMALTATTSNYNMLWSAIAALSVIAVLAYLAIERLEQAVLRVYAQEQLRS